jgi:hypothetical protein
MAPGQWRAAPFIGREVTRRIASDSRQASALVGRSQVAGLKDLRLMGDVVGDGSSSHMFKSEHAYPLRAVPAVHG